MPGPMPPSPVPSDKICAANLGRIVRAEEGHEIPAEQGVPSVNLHLSGNMPKAVWGFRPSFASSTKEKPLASPVLLTVTICAN